MNKKIVLTLIGLCLIAFAVIPKIEAPKVIPVPTPVVNLDIEKPTEDILSLVSGINSKIKDPQDRIKLAVFNYCFGKRVLNYSTQTQNIQDIYVIAAEKFFGQSIKGKYPDLANNLTTLFKNGLGDENHIIKQEEKLATSNIFSGLAWSLIQ